MSCCTPIIQAFNNQSETTIPFTAAQRTIYGSVPNVKVLYLQDGEFVEGTGFMTSIKLDGDSLIINHGGAATGLIKIN